MTTEQQKTFTNPCAMVASYATATDITYKLTCPPHWFDLWGWKGEEDSNA